MKFLKIAGGVVGLLVLAVVGAAAMQPSHQHVERSVTVKAGGEDIHPYLTDFTNFPKWSPWQDLDPAQKTTISKPPSGRGASLHWSGNDQVGEGEMKIIEVIPEKKVVESLHFIRPFEANATITFTIEESGDTSKLTWAYDGERSFMEKAVGLFMDMDQMLGADFEKGLAKVGKLAEDDARVRAEDQARAQAALAAEQAAAAAQAAASGEAVPAAGAAVPGTVPGTIPQ